MICITSSNNEQKHHLKGVFNMILNNVILLSIKFRKSKCRTVKTTFFKYLKLNLKVKANWK